jgi:Spy/CpxP family protein refolding chaperone
MRRITTAVAPFAVLALTALGALAACSKSAATATADASPEVDAPAASAAESASASDASSDAGPVDAASPAPVVHHHGLAGNFFRAALDLPELTDDAKAAIDKIEEPIRSDPGIRHEMSTYHQDLAAGLKANRFDSAKLQADEAAITKVLATRQDEQATALNALHAALTADQRKAVAESLKSAQAGHDHPPPPMSDAGASEWAAHRLERMKSQLVLDMDQQKEVAAVLAKNAPPSPAVVQLHVEAAKKQFDTLVAAFEKDPFDAKKLDLSTTPGRKPTAPLDAQVKYLQQLMPVLTAGQRDRLAVGVERPRDMKTRGESIAEPFDMGGGR